MICVRILAPIQSSRRSLLRFFRLTLDSALLHAVLMVLHFTALANGARRTLPRRQEEAAPLLAMSAPAPAQSPRRS